jgi:hypothetical protein
MCFGTFRRARISGTDMSVFETHQEQLNVIVIAIAVLGSTA